MSEMESKELVLVFDAVYLSPPRVGLRYTGLTLVLLLDSILILCTAHASSLFRPTFGASDGPACI